MAPVDFRTTWTLTILFTIDDKVVHCLSKAYNVNSVAIRDDVKVILVEIDSTQHPDDLFFRLAGFGFIGKAAFLQRLIQRRTSFG
jgi:hypothetical protein